jgi:tetratricopeptide (TPR) repeat protein
MKFKTIYILFNAVILVSFAFIFFMPLALLGSEYFSFFVAKNWIAGALFAATLIAINGYFLANWTLFRLLEKEDWQGLIGFLEERIFQKGRLRRNYVKMLINAYLVTSQVAKIAVLESRLRDKRPRLLRIFALQFGIPYLLSGDAEAAEKYFGRYGEQKGVRHRGWLRWNYAFSLLQQKQLEAAKATLLELLDSNPEPVLHLLTAYMLASLIRNKPETEQRVQEARRRLAALYSPERWERKIESSSRHIQMVLLTPIIHEAKEWLFPKAEDVAEDQRPSHPTVH